MEDINSRQRYNDEQRRIAALQIGESVCEREVQKSYFDNPSVLPTPAFLSLLCPNCSLVDLMCQSF